jgi:hypothetical protein
VVSDHNGGVALICDQIPKGAKPGDVAILQPIPFEPSFNLKMAKAIDFKIPELLAVADEVIE